MNATGGVKLPYGNIPRLLLAYITTEAVRTHSRVLVLEDSLSAFMRKLGIYSTSGRGHTRLRNQMDLLFHASVTLTYEDEQSRRYMTSPITDAGEFWWNPKQPDDRSLWESKIELGEKFFEEIIRHPVPLDMNILKAMKAVLVGSRPLPVARLPHVPAQDSDAAVVEGALSAVRRGPGQGKRQVHRS